MKKSNLFRILLASIALVSITSCGGKTGPQGEQGVPGVTGPQGNDGASLLNGHGVPEETLGQNGDSYVDLDTWDYYTKDNNTWTKQGNIKGDKGEDAENPTQEGTIGLDFYPLDDGTVGVRAGKASELSNIIIPSTYMGYTVSAILSNAFSGCSKLKTISIPDTVTSIENRAFYNCSSLTIYCEAPSKPSNWDSSWNPDNRPVVWGVYGETKSNLDYHYILTNNSVYIIKYIGSSADVTIPSVIDEKPVTTIGDSAFLGRSLTSITIPDSVTSIGSYAFRGCSSLTSVTIPNSVTSIGYDAFYNCSHLQYNEYDRCYYLGNETNPYLVLVSCFDNTVSSISIAENCRFIYNSAFDSCSSLTSVTIPNSVTSIGNSAFLGCSSLTSIEMPNSVTSIEHDAFSGCSSLTSIEIPNSVISIGDHAFYGCSSLTSITIPNSVTSIGNFAFYSCSSLISISIPNSVISIGNYAFKDCSKLTSIKISNSVTSIGDSAFYNCSSLTSITIPNSVTSIGDSAFSYCSSITSITIPNSVTSIDEGAFSYCSSLLYIIIPISVTSIGYHAFYNCSLLRIYCEASSEPSGWSSSWNPDKRPVVWGYVS